MLKILKESHRASVYMKGAICGDKLPVSAVPDRYLLMSDNARTANLSAPDGDGHDVLLGWRPLLELPVSTMVV